MALDFLCISGRVSQSHAVPAVPSSASFQSEMPVRFLKASDVGHGGDAVFPLENECISPSRGGKASALVLTKGGG